MTTSRRAWGFAASCAFDQSAQAASSAAGSSARWNCDLRRRLAQRSFAHAIVSAPCSEEMLAAWAECGRSRQAAAAGAPRCRLAEFAINFERKARGADQVAVAADFVESSEPAAECSRILIPADARAVFEELRGIVAEQMVRVHGERGQAIARRPASCTASGAASATMPAHSDCSWSEFSTTRPSSTRSSQALRTKRLPISNVGRGPCGEPFGAAGAMKGGGEGSRGALAGGNHKAAVAQPRIDR